MYPCFLFFFGIFYEGSKVICVLVRKKPQLISNLPEERSLFYPYRINPLTLIESCPVIHYLLNFYIKTL